MIIGVAIYSGAMLLAFVVTGSAIWASVRSLLMELGDPTDALSAITAVFTGSEIWITIGVPLISIVVTAIFYKQMYDTLSAVYCTSFSSAFVMTLIYKIIRLIIPVIAMVPIIGWIIDVILLLVNGIIYLLYFILSYLGRLIQEEPATQSLFCLIIDHLWE